MATPFDPHSCSIDSETEGAGLGASCVGGNWKCQVRKQGLAFPRAMLSGMCGSCIFTFPSRLLSFWKCFILSKTKGKQEKAMATHSSTLAWNIPWTEVPGRLQSLGSRRVGCDWVTSLSLFIFMHWRRKWQPTPVFLPGESQGRRSLVGCRLWVHTESDTTDTS